MFYTYQLLVLKLFYAIVYKLDHSELTHLALRNVIRQKLELLQNIEINII